MTLQGSRLVMIGRGIDDHEQPHDQFPEVPNGNHLRWSFDPTVGFARHGYHLFRREHVGDRIDPTPLADYVGGSTGTRRTHTITTPAGSVDVDLDAPASIVSNGQLAIPVDPGPVTVRFPEPVFEVRATLHVTAPTTVRALAGGVTVDSTDLDADGTVTLSFDRIEAVELEGGPATVEDVAFFPVSREYGQGWTPVPAFDEPLGLPLYHGDYPATGGHQQDLASARSIAQTRIEYGDPNHYTATTAVHDDGHISVDTDSLVVTGTNTNWDHSLTGRRFSVAGDDTAYVVTEVRPGDDAPDELLLSRPYEGQSQTNTAYELADDRFGALHDYLVHLLDDSPGSGGQLGRTIPTPLETGQAAHWTGGTWIYDFGGGPTRDVEGLYVQFATETTGTISVTQGSTTVERDPGSTASPEWHAGLEGLPIRFEDQRAVYTIESVDTASGRTLELDRPYSGPDLANASFAVFEAKRYGIERTAVSGQYLRLDAPYRNPRGVSEYLVTGAFGSQGETATSPWQNPLETTLLGSVEPAIAQALGLYWIDTDADRDRSYDYLLVADHDGVLEDAYGEDEPFDPRNLELFADGVEAVDGYITFDVERGAAPPVERPTGAAAHDLPPSPPESHSTPSGERYGTNTAGLRWDEGAGARGAMLPDDPVQYHLWRHDYQSDERPSTAPPPAAYDPLTAPAVADTDRDDPIAVSDADTTNAPGWPNQSIDTVDRGLLDGWYSYRLNGVDLFGRASDLGEPADWIDDGTTKHPSAIHLVDDQAPPPPRQVDAQLLDVDQPTAGTGELEVSWIWPETLAAQAPDAVEFTVQYYPGQLNEQFGEITSVAEPYDDYLEIETDVPAIDPADGYVGATLQVGDASYDIVESDAARDGTLSVTVRDERPSPPTTVETTDGSTPVEITDSRPNATTGATPAESVESAIRRDRPESGSACTISIPPTVSGGTIAVADGDRTVYGYDTDWSRALVGQAFTTPDGNEYTVTAVDGHDELTLDEPYVVPDPNESERTRFAYAIEHPVRVDYDDPDAWASATEPSDWRSTHATISIEDAVEEVAASDPDNPLDTSYRAYETTVPIPRVDDPPRDPFATSEAEPVTYAHVGVNTHDRQGNVGDVSAPVTVSRVLEEAPVPPTQPSFESAIDYATPPDYDGQSKYTVRFAHPGEHRTVHVYRAMDKAIFRADYAKRNAGDATRSLDPTNPDHFPPYRRDDSSVARRKQIRDTIESLHDAVTAAGSFQAALEHYRDLEPDVLQTLAGLDGTREAYAKRTIEALDPDEHPNVRGPDFESGDPGPGYTLGANPPPGAVPGSDLCAWVDAFDGKTRRRYFYRTSTVNEAGIESEELSYPTRPVQAVDTVPPTAPSVTDVTGGDRSIELTLASNREPDLSEYQLYRTTDKSKATDIRRMIQVATLSEDRPPVAGTSSTTGRPSSVSITDTGVDVARTYYYRVVAVDEAGNVSDSSKRCAGQAYATSPPPEPTWDRAEWVAIEADGTVHDWASAPATAEPAIELAWSLQSPGSQPPAVLLQQASDSGLWQTLSSWSDRDTGYLVRDVQPSQTHEFRVKIRDRAGNIATGPARTVSPPEDN
ncbi:hypothetical protein [Halorubellus litoreus]|uniref:Fibronectin type-III domain-containing protein n=1 Tax=Halorubellus litoreus TaxID=755308 RepID=A0ABD5VLW3_9EURY